MFSVVFKSQLNSLCKLQIANSLFFKQTRKLFVNTFEKHLFSILLRKGVFIFNWFKLCFFSQKSSWIFCLRTPIFHFWEESKFYTKLWRNHAGKQFFREIKTYINCTVLNRWLFKFWKMIYFVFFNIICHLCKPTFLILLLIFFYQNDNSRYNIK